MSDSAVENFAQHVRAQFLKSKRSPSRLLLSVDVGGNNNRGVYIIEGRQLITVSYLSFCFQGAPVCCLVPFQRRKMGRRSGLTAYELKQYFSLANYSGKTMMMGVMGRMMLQIC